MSNHEHIAQQAVNFTDLADLETEQISGGAKYIFNDRFILNINSIDAPYGFVGSGFGSVGFSSTGFGGQQQQQQIKQSDGNGIIK